MSSVQRDQVLVLTKWAQKWLKFGWNIVLDGTPREQVASKIIKELDAVLNEPTYYIDDVVEERVRMVAVKVDLSTTARNNTKTGDLEGSGVERTLEEIAKSTESNNVVKQVVSRKVTQTIRKKQRSNFSAAVAKSAYNKFGERPMSAANILVTRKWLQKYLSDQFKDLRTCDKNLAIDRALFLSFVPTKDFLNMRIVMETKAMEDRMKGSTWFGRVFRLATGPSSDLVPL